MKIKLFFTIIFLFLSGCTNSDDTTTTATKTSYYDPRIPFGVLTNSSSLAGKLLNVTADVSELGRITLNWVIPPVYNTMDYKVKIYKKRGDDPSFTLPDPSDEASGAQLYLRTELKAVTFTDQDYRDSENELVLQVEQGATYTYWLYLNVGDKWSDGIKLAVTARTAADNFVFPNPATFWQNLRWSFGNPPTPPSAFNPNSIISIASMNDYGPKSFPYSPEIGKPTGGIGLAYSGNVMYYADTPNNRVIIYTRGLAYSCDQYIISDPELYLACTYQYASAPLTASNILGQDSHYSKKQCSDYEIQCSPKSTQSSCESTSTMCTWKTDLNILPQGGYCSGKQKCLNQPTKVSVFDNKLFISDSGNNRIVVYDALPVLGCDKDLIPGTPRPVDCNPSFVVGKQGLNDLNNYPISNSSLNFPTGVAVKDNNLYIADTNNNRVVMIKDYNDRSQFDCSDPINWNQALCSFTSVLGQKDFVSKWTFKEGSNDGSNTTRDGVAGYDGITCTTLTNCTSPYSTGILNDSLTNLNLARQFRKPVEIKFSNDGKLLVSSNEEILLYSPLGTSQMRGRILIWDNNPMVPGANQCNPSFTLADMDSNVNCLASKIIGQELPNKLITLSSNAKYRDSAFGLDSVDSFDLRNNFMISADFLNNYIYQWNDFTLTPLAGTPSNSKVVNPEGSLDNSTGSSRYLPNLQGISDIKFAPNNNLIFVSDPFSSKVHEVRAYNYETPSN